jgi:hypothetical protein
MLKVLIKRVLLSLFFVPIFFILLLWVDLRYNASSLLKNVVEYGLGSKDFSVNIELITPNYLHGRFTLQGVKINSYNKVIASVDKAVCDISSGKELLAFDAFIEPFSIFSTIASNICLTNVRALCSLDLRKGTGCILLSEENNVEIGKILIEPSKIQGSLAKSFAQEGLNGKGTVSFFLDRNQGCYHLSSKANLAGFNCAIAQITNVLNLRCPIIEGDIAFCAWEIDYASDRDGRDVFSKFKTLKLNAQLLNCFGTKNLPPIKQMIVSLNLLDNKLTGEVSSEELGKDKKHVVCLEYSDGILSGSGMLNPSAAPLIKRALDSFLYLKDSLDNFVLNKQTQWNYLLDCSTGSFNLDVKTRLNKAKISVSQGDLVFSDMDLSATFNREHLKIKALGVLQNIDTKIDYLGTFERSGKHNGEIRCNLLKPINFANFAFEKGSVLIKFQSSKYQDFGYKFCANCDLANLALSCNKMAFEKDVGKNALLKLNGIISKDAVCFNLNETSLWKISKLR